MTNKFDKLKDCLIKTALDTDEGRRKLAMAMAAPIARRVFYHNTYEIYCWDFYE